ncbi:MAG TPA: hypothetical protein PLX55_01755 [bacterium]|nr:hypothetical protein [bacterium]
MIASTVTAFAMYYFLTRGNTTINNEITSTSDLITTTSENNEQKQDFVYMKRLMSSSQGQADIILSNFDGSSKSIIQTVSKYVGPLNNNDVSQAGHIIYATQSETEESLWVSNKGDQPKNILTLPKNKFIESAKISSDGTMIAYSLLDKHNPEGELWTINADGADNKMIIANTGRYIVEQIPFRLAPLAWSKDKTKIYMITTADSDATPSGMYVADLATAKIQKAKTPDITLWGVSFSPNEEKIAYTTFEWKDVPDSRPEAGPPFTINITDLNTGATEKVLENQNKQYFDPIWSPDGKKIMYKTATGFENDDSAIHVVDINTKKTHNIVSSVKNTKMIPWTWLSNERVAYTEESYTTGRIQDKVTTYLFTVKTDGTDKQSIDSATDLIVFGSLKK